MRTSCSFRRWVLLFAVVGLHVVPALPSSQAAEPASPFSEGLPVQLDQKAGSSGAAGAGGVQPGAPSPTPTSTSTSAGTGADSVVAQQPAQPPRRPEPAAREIPGRGGSATTASAAFPNWYRNALAVAAGWRFPTAVNKYGRQITREDFLAAILWIESNGVHRNGSGQITTSWSGARGFGQLMPNTARGLGVNPDDPAQNLKGSAKYLGEILASPNISRTKDPAKTLIMTAAAYNLGPYSPELRHDWDVFKGLTRAETVGYGLKLKMCLGFEMTPTEKQMAARLQGIPVGQIDRLADEYYGYTRGIAAKKGN